MDGLVIFDEMNDVVYTKFNKKFVHHIQNSTTFQGLIINDKKEETGTDELSRNVVIQIFSPIITSQKIMSSQFGNSYNNLQCVDGLNIVFEEYMGYMIIHAGKIEVECLQRMVGITINAIKYLCGLDVGLLKTNAKLSDLLTQVLNTWQYLYSTEQSFLVECTEQLLVNSELGTTTLQALHLATDCMTKEGHALVFVGNKFLSLYSSRVAQELSPTDILFLGLLSHSLCTTASAPSNNEIGERSDSEDEECNNGHSTTFASAENEVNDPNIHSNVIFLTNPISIPHIIYTTALSDSVYLLLISEAYHFNLSPGLFEIANKLDKVKALQLQRDIDGLKPAFDNLDIAFKHITEGLKKCKIHTAEIENYHKRLQNKWTTMKKKYTDFFKTGDNDCLVKIESSMSGLNDILKDLFRCACLNEDLLDKGGTKALLIAENVRLKLSGFSDFLKVKALRNFTLGSRASLTINKYLEEFPGLVHFMYIDRSQNRLTAPSLEFSSQETLTLTKEKIWSMVEFSRSYLSRGHLAILWKDTIFNYAYFLWFEDGSGSPIKPKEPPLNRNSLKPLPQPGVLCGDFYLRLIESCFPKLPASKVRCYELYCIHLGLASASCVLEHSRRLAATIWEVTGAPTNPLDLL